LRGKVCHATNEGHVGALSISVMFGRAVENSAARGLSGCCCCCR